MLYMVIERFKSPGAVDVYRRARERGRMLPDGLKYVTSWVDLDFSTCFQLMETNHEQLFKERTGHWNDLVDFQIVQVRTSEEASQMMQSRL